MVVIGFNPPPVVGPDATLVFGEHLPVVVMKVSILPRSSDRMQRWYLRSAIVWHKPFQSSLDRLTGCNPRDYADGLDR